MWHHYQSAAEMPYITWPFPVDVIWLHHLHHFQYQNTMCNHCLRPHWLDMVNYRYPLYSPYCIKWLLSVEATWSCPIFIQQLQTHTGGTGMSIHEIVFFVQLLHSYSLFTLWQEYSTPYGKSVRCLTYIHVTCIHGPGQGVLRFELDRDVPPEPRNPYPFLRVIFSPKSTHF